MAGNNSTLICSDSLGNPNDLLLSEDLVDSNGETTNHIAGNQSLDMSRMQSGVQINRKFATTYKRSM